MDDTLLVEEIRALRKEVRHGLGLIAAVLSDCSTAKDVGHTEFDKVFYAGRLGADQEIRSYLRTGETMPREGKPPDVTVKVEG